MSVFSATTFYNIQPPAATGPTYAFRTDAYSASLVLAMPGAKFPSLGMAQIYSDVSADIRGTGNNFNLAPTGSGIISSSNLILNFSGSNWASEGYDGALAVGGSQNAGQLPAGALNWGASNFVFETYLTPVAPRWANPPYQLHILGNNNGDSFLAQWSFNNNMNFYTNPSGGALAFARGANYQTYIHIAMVRSGSNKYFYINGTKVATGTYASTIGSSFTDILGVVGVNDTAGKVITDLRVYIGTDKGYTGATITVPPSMIYKVT